MHKAEGVRGDEMRLSEIDCNVYRRLRLVDPHIEAYCNSRKRQPFSAAQTSYLHAFLDFETPDSPYKETCRVLCILHIANTAFRTDCAVR